jgi:hypothetical protein
MVNVVAPNWENCPDMVASMADVAVRIPTRAVMPNAMMSSVRIARNG